jgi:hypothetical protein
MTDTPWTAAGPDRIDIADELHNGPSEGDGRVDSRCMNSCPDEF